MIRVMLSVYGETTGRPLRPCWPVAVEMATGNWIGTGVNSWAKLSPKSKAGDGLWKARNGGPIDIKFAADGDPPELQA